MSCSICGRSSCTESFHSIEEQTEQRDFSLVALESKNAELHARVTQLEEALKVAKEEIHRYFVDSWFGICKMDEIEHKWERLYRLNPKLRQINEALVSGSAPDGCGEAGANHG